MVKPKTIGFPRMRVEAGEKRVFLPELINAINDMGLHVYIEEGYGSRLGYTFDSFQRGSETIHRCSREEAFAQDLVLILRSPKRAEYALLSPHSCLISMLHFPTRPGRVNHLISNNIKAISLDSIVDDYSIRRVENMKAVAWNGLETAFLQLAEQWENFIKPDGNPAQVLILGTGMVGKHAVEAATKLGNIEHYNDHIQAGGLGSIAISVGRAVTQSPNQMKKLMQNADILVDATQRRNPSQAVIPNEWIAWLPEHAIIVDLAVDPYLPNNDPPIVRGVEGIPMGNLDQYVFYPDDPTWCSQIPEGVPTQNRRTSVSCYSWPGIHPEACMEHYARQLMPMIEVLVEKGYDELQLEGSFFERALYRGTLKAFMEIRPA
jgi:alanine dehydrogenase